MKTVLSTWLYDAYFILSNNHRVWNKGIGWKHTYGSINIWYGIVVLGGTFLKISEQVRRNNLIGWIFLQNFDFFFMKFSNLHRFNTPFWCILKANMSEKLILERLCRIGLRFLAKSINMGYGIRACWEEKYRGINNHTPTLTLVTLIAVQDILIIFKHFSSQDILIRDRTFSYFWKLWRKLFNSCRNTIRKGKKH